MFHKGLKRKDNISFWLSLALMVVGFYSASATAVPYYSTINIFPTSIVKTPEILEPDQAFLMSINNTDKNTLSVYWDIAEGYYLYRDKFDFSFQDDEITITAIELSEGVQKNDPEFGNVQVNYNNASARLTLQNINTDIDSALLLVQYQGCKENTICYPPVSKFIPVSLSASANTDILQTDGQFSEQDLITKRLSDSNFWQNIIAFLGFGLLLSLTPCIFPMVPILSGIIVGQNIKPTIIQAFFISITYVIAMASTYAILGIIASLFAFNLQIASQNIWVITAFSSVFVLLALSMFGFYELKLPIPNSWHSKFTGGTGQPTTARSLGNIAAMGALSAIIVGPCVAPPLAGALLYISQTGDTVLGGAALFAMGIGMGTPLLLIGTSGGKLLPKAGPWMESIKHILGILMLATAIWFMERVLPVSLTLMLWALLFIICSTYMKDSLHDPARRIWQKKLWHGVSTAMSIYGIILMVGAASGGDSMLKPLQSLFNQSGRMNVQTLPFRRVKDVDDLRSALYQATYENKLVMLDFYADWCVTCKEIEYKTFTDMNVRSALNDFILLQADVTKNDGLDSTLLKKFDLFGPPAILFFNRQGLEEKSYRLIGFINAEDFIRHVDKIVGKNNKRLNNET